MSASRIERLESVDSTQDEIHRRARTGAAELLWISADRQTKGRGRRGRAWLSDSDDLKASALLRPIRRKPGLGIGETATLSFVISLALADALRALGVRDEIRLKWPNDVLVEGRKIAGLLLEAEGEAADPWIALGVGLNLKSAPEAASMEEGALASTALDRHGVVADREQALAAVVAAFEARYEQWLREGFAGLREVWLAQAAGFGGPAVARLPGERIEGRFADVDASGALVLHTETGLRRVHAAEVFFPQTG